MKKYRVKNRLAQYVKDEKYRMVLESGGKRVLLVEVEEKVANSVGLTLGSFKNLKKNITSPSIITALRVAEYFNVHVEDIFYIEEYEEDC